MPQKSNPHMPPGLPQAAYSIQPLRGPARILPAASAAAAGDPLAWRNRINGA
jgi:hypothetical protein